jgi:hypothetical protein
VTRVLALAALLLAGAASAEVGPGAVWTPPDGALAGVRACAAKTGDARACLLDAMTKAGAPQAARDFTASLSGAGYLRRFVERGRVDLAFAEFPLRANSNRSVLLVNGSPAAVDVSSPSLVSALDADRRLDAVRRDAPDASVWASLAGFPGMKEHDGGQRFSFAMPVRTCRACADLATAYATYDFAADGEFRGAQLVEVTPENAFAVSGTVEAGKPFSAPLGGGLEFRLTPFAEGWTISVQDARGRDHCAPVTPPYRGANPLVIHGADLRGGRGRTRTFRCATAAGYGDAVKTLDALLWGPKDGAAAARAAHARAEDAARRGSLTVRTVRLGGAPDAPRPPIATMTFSVTLAAAPAAAE